MDHHLGKIGFRFLKSDPCVYVYEDENGSAIPTLYVDDILELGANKQLLDKLKKHILDRFEIEDMGDARNKSRTPSRIKSARADLVTQATFLAEGFL